MSILMQHSARPSNLSLIPALAVAKKSFYTECSMFIFTNFPNRSNLLEKEEKTLLVFTSKYHPNYRRYQKMFGAKVS